MLRKSSDHPDKKNYSTEQEMSRASKCEVLHYVHCKSRFISYQNITFHDAF